MTEKDPKGDYIERLTGWRNLVLGDFLRAEWEAQRCDLEALLLVWGMANWRDGALRPMPPSASEMGQLASAVAEIEKAERQTRSRILQALIGECACQHKGLPS